MAANAQLTGHGAMPASTATGVLLVGHGTRSEIGKAQFLAIAERLGVALGPRPVKPAFLELAQPNIDVAIEQLLARGVERIAIVPLLLFCAAHAKADIPSAVRSALVQRARGDVAVLQTGHLGCHAAIVELSKLRMEESIGGVAWAATSKKLAPEEAVDTAQATCLLLVGRGSNDESATAEMHDFAGLRQQSLQNIDVQVAFLAMARPLLAERLPTIAAQHYKRVIVQPHLLFHGELVDSVQRQVAEIQPISPQIEWVLTPPLANRPAEAPRGCQLLEWAVLDRCQEAGIHDARIRVVAIQPDD